MTIPRSLFRLGLFVLAAVVSCTGIPRHGVASNPPDGGTPTLVFITKSDACSCQLNLCMAGEQEIVNFMADNPYGFRLERIDLAEDPAAGPKHKVFAVPVVLLVDPGGLTAARLDTFFTEDEIYKAWEGHLERVKGNP